MTDRKQSTDHAQSPVAGTKLSTLTPKDTSASKGIPAHNPSGQNADTGNRNKRS